MTGKILKIKAAKRVQRKRRIRSKIAGCATLPRVSVFRSNRYISAQAINDEQGVTLASVHSKTLGLRANKEGAEKAAAAFAKPSKTPESTRLRSIVTVSCTTVWLKRLPNRFAQTKSSFKG